MKDQYAVDPQHNLNIYVTCQDPSEDGTILLGIATFPWDPGSSELNIDPSLSSHTKFRSLSHFVFVTFSFEKKDALTKQGGLWVNSLSLSTEWQNDRDKTLQHEMGHNLGLWHTFHGVSEVAGCNDPCREVVHEFTDPKADLVGM